MTSRRVAMAASCETTCRSCTDKPSCDDGRSGVLSSSMSHDLPWIVLATSMTQCGDSSIIVTELWMHGDVANVTSCHTLGIDMVL